LNGVYSFLKKPHCTIILSTALHWSVTVRELGDNGNVKQAVRKANYKGKLRTIDISSRNLSQMLDSQELEEDDNMGKTLTQETNQEEHALLIDTHIATIKRIEENTENDTIDSVKV